MSATTVATLIAKLEMQSRDFDTKIASAERALKRVETQSRSTGQGLLTMSRVMTAAVAGGAAVAARDLYNLGVKAEAWGRRYNTVFQGVTAEMDAWVKDQGASFGVAEDHLKGMAAAVGDLLVPMGFTRAAAGGMTQEILTLSNALSEWTGGTMKAEEAQNAITRAMLGEREALIPLGVKISELDVQSRLAAKGQAELTGEALQQARTLVTLELITERSADAMTAYADGGSEAARAAKELSAQIETLKVRLGEALIEAAPLVGLLGDLVGFAGQTVDITFNLIPGTGSSDILVLLAAALGLKYGRGVGVLAGMAGLSKGAARSIGAATGMTLGSGEGLITREEDLALYMEALGLGKSRGRGVPRGGYTGVPRGSDRLRGGGAGFQEFRGPGNQTQMFNLRFGLREQLALQTEIAEGVAAAVSRAQGAATLAAAQDAFGASLAAGFSESFRKHEGDLTKTLGDVLAAAATQRRIGDMMGQLGAVGLDKFAAGFTGSPAEIEQMLAAILASPEALYETAFALGDTTAMRLIQAMTNEGEFWAAHWAAGGASDGAAYLAAFLASVSGLYGPLTTSEQQSQLFALRFSSEPGRHSGGMVPGPSGATVPIMAMAGERVIPAGLSSGGGGSSVNVYVAGSVVSERDLVDAVRRGLRGERIRGGSLEL